MKIKLFYSYSHQDEIHRYELEKHLATLRDVGLVDEWHDRKINAGDDWSDEIEKNMADSNIILLLFSADFIASKSCQKEVEKALELKSEKGIIFIPIILKKCAWEEVEGVSSVQALPKDAKPVNQWDDKDDAWNNIYKRIKEKAENLRSEIKPILKNDFKDELLKNPVSDCVLDKLFVYPDILETSKLKQKLEQNEVDSEKLCDIENFKHKYILIEGKEQSGKTSLCNMLYLDYVKNNFYPILINGKDITGKAVIDDIVNKAYQGQYESTGEYWNVDKKDRILIIDDINNRTANDSNYSAFLQSIKNQFEYAIILIDSLKNLVDKSTEHNYFYPFNDYSIKSFGHKKRGDLIKKCIENNENSEFDMQNTEQVARLDKDTNHINTIIQSNIVPSYPIIIISSFNIIESATPQDTKETSYGHCYHAMITTQLYRANIKPNSLDEYFKFLTELAYFMFNKNIKNISKEYLDIFLKDHKDKYIFEDAIVNKLIESSVLVMKGKMYSFQYVYIYYYFVAKYMADNFNSIEVKEQFERIISTIHKKDNFNIITFIVHHAKNDVLNILLDDISRNAKKAFENFSVATLDKKEIKFLDKAIQDINIGLPSKEHSVEKHRDKQLEQQDKSQPVVDKQEKAIENNEDNLDSLTIEILKSAKSMDLIGQILKNQYGTFEKNKLKELFEEGQNVGLRLLKSFMDLIKEQPDGLKDLIEKRLIEITEERDTKLSKEKIQRISQQMANRFSYGVVFGWLHKIVDSLGYDKLVTISDDVNDDMDTTASQLISFSIHTWHKKNLDIDKLKSLYKKLDKDKNHTAQHILKDIVSRHIYMHEVSYQKKQQINDLLGFSMQQQRIAQSKIDVKK